MFVIVIDVLYKYIFVVNIDYRRGYIYVKCYSE